MANFIENDVDLAKSRKRPSWLKEAILLQSNDDGSVTVISVDSPKEANNLNPSNWENIHNSLTNADKKLIDTTCSTKHKYHLLIKTKGRRTLIDKRSKEMNGESGSPPVSPGSSGSSGRKQLPPLPESGSATPTTLNQKRDGHSTPAGHSYGQYFMEYSLLAEYNQIQKQKLPGVYVIPSAKSPLIWFGVLFIRQGLYQEGVFKFSLFIPENYPDGDCPKLVFEQPIFHPVINPETGELDVKRGFQKWRRNVNHLWQVLLYARRVFYKIDTKDASNPEAAVLYEKDMDLFKSRVTESVTACKQHLYDEPSTDDVHAIRFSPFDSEIHGVAKSKMLQAKDPMLPDDKSAQSSGLSWMKKGTNVIFSKAGCPSL